MMRYNAIRFNPITAR